MLSTVQWLALAGLGLVAGLSFVMQQIVNTNLKSGLTSPLWAAFVSYAGGTLLVALLLLATQQGVPSRHAIAGTSWPSWLGGAFGVVYVLASIALLPRVGAATSIALIVAGEMLNIRHIRSLRITGADEASHWHDPGRWRSAATGGCRAHS